MPCVFENTAGNAVEQSALAVPQPDELVKIFRCQLYQFRYAFIGVFLYIACFHLKEFFLLALFPLYFISNQRIYVALKPAGFFTINTRMVFKIFPLSAAHLTDQFKQAIVFFIQFIGSHSMALSK